MPVEAATNCWTEAEDALVAALPQLAEFRLLMREATDVGAAKHIYLEETDQPLDGKLSREDREQLGSLAIVTSDPNQPYKLKQGPEGDFYPSGRLVFALERMIPENEWKAQENQNISRGQVYRWSKNRVGTVVSQLVAYWQENGGPYVREVNVSGPLENNPESWESEGRSQLFEISIDWGLVVED